VQQPSENALDVLSVAAPAEITYPSLMTDPLPDWQILDATDITDR
jgi:hypothetical protein